MANYLLAYHGGGMPATDAERATVMQEWGQWFGALGADLVDGGNPIGQIRTIAASGSVRDGGGANPGSGHTAIKAHTPHPPPSPAPHPPPPQSRPPPPAR